MVKKLLENFSICKIKLTIRPLEKLILPEYKGSTIRGGFGYIFKKVCCQTGKYNCSDCHIRDQCLYIYIFETPISNDSLVQEKNSFAPHPFIIELPLDSRKVFMPTDVLHLNLVLIGKAIQYLPYFILTFIELGKTGLGKNKTKYSLEKVEDCFSSDRSNTVLYDCLTQKMIKKPVILSEDNFFADIDKNGLSDKISISFLSPTRIKYQGKFVSDRLDFPVFIKNLLRRISALSYFHCNHFLDLDFKEIINLAHSFKTVYSDLHWHDWERFSTRQKSKMKLGGFEGIVSYGYKHSDITFQLLRFIRIGELIHIGKGASFGLGQYRILEV